MKFDDVIKTLQKVGKFALFFLLLPVYGGAMVFLKFTYSWWEFLWD